MVKARALMSFGEMNAPEAKRDFHSYGMGWMYRTSDVAAAYARAGLKHLTRTNQLARRNYDYLQEKLAGLPGFVAPKETKHSKGNGYAYVLRVDPGLVKRREDLAPYRDAVIQALTAEGVPVASARWMLPAHTVFQAKNGYGHGCPWSCPHARPGISYALKQYPVSLKVIDSCIQIAINGHRPPNGRKELDAIVQGVRKVFEHLDQVPLPEGR
jgi:dTDP-4-amino-4,6-dideoxygalactose transaminase